MGTAKEGVHPKVLVSVRGIQRYPKGVSGWQTDVCKMIGENLSKPSKMLNRF